MALYPPSPKNTLSLPSSYKEGAAKSVKNLSNIPLTAESQANVIAYAQSVLTAQAQFTELHSKFEMIDKAYACFTDTNNSEIGTDGVDNRAEAGGVCCNVFGDDTIVAPIVVSQVDSVKAYLSEIFLSGSPIFPVVSTPANRKFAEQLEVLVDDHATLGGYVRQLLLMINDGVKYNFSAIETDWDSINQFSVLADFGEDNPSGKKLDRADKFYTKLKRLDPYNTVWDYTVNPGDVAAEGDYAGYVEIMSKTKLKRLLNKLSSLSESMNIQEAFASVPMGGGVAPTVGQTGYKVHPTVSDYITPTRPDSRINWTSWITGIPIPKGSAANPNLGANYEVFRLYARILPSDFGIQGPQPNTPQIWKFIIVNGSIIVSAKRIISAYDYLPILFGQPLEDGLGYQTRSIGEMQIKIQEGATKLYNIRFAAARRAVSDRALYDPNIIDEADINAPVSAPKIPVRLSGLLNASFDRAYKQIPFDMRGTESTINDAAQIVEFSRQLTGVNGPQQGMFQKGNKSVQEWNDTIGNSDNRLRLPALVYEYQVFVPLKSILALNIYQFGSDTIVVSQKTGEVINIKIDDLRKQVLSFRLADGYTPKSKLASTDMIAQGMQMIQQSPILQQAYGANLPAMFAHLMELGGVRGLDEYNPQADTTQQQSAAPNANAIQNAPNNTGPSGQAALPTQNTNQTATLPAAPAQ